jgi:PST family polysaccharide transporter
MISTWMLRLLPAFLRARIAGRSYLLRVIDNTGWILAERILRHAVGFAIGIAIARYVGPEQYGVLNYAAAFVVVFSFMGALGLDTVAVREMVRDPTSRDGVLGTLVVLRLIGGLLMTLVIALAVRVVNPGDPRVYPLILLFAGATLLQATDSIDCWFQANLTSYHTVFARLGALLTAAAVRGGMIVLHAPLIAFAWATLVESVLLTVAMLLVYRRSGQPISRLRPTLAKAGALLEEGWPLLLSAVVVTVSQRLDQVLLGAQAGFAEVGAYAIAVRMIEVTYIVPAVIATSIFPAMIKLRSQDSAHYEAQMQRLCSVMFWLAIAVAVPLFLLSGVIVRVLFGSAYDAAVRPLALLSWMPVFVFFNMVRQRWLLAEHAVAVALAVEIAACGLSIGANLLLVPRYGAAGAAMAALVGAAGSALVVAPFSRNIRRSLAMLAIGAIAPLRAWRRA